MLTKIPNSQVYIYVYGVWTCIFLTKTSIFQENDTVEKSKELGPHQCKLNWVLHVIFKLTTHKI